MANYEFSNILMNFRKKHILYRDDVRETEGDGNIIENYTIPVGLWVAIGCSQPGNRIFVFKEKNDKLLQTGETIQYGSIVKVDNLKIFSDYFYKGKIISKKKIFAQLTWKSNQHLGFNKKNRYIRAASILFKYEIKENNILLDTISKSNLYNSHYHPKLKNNKLPTSKSDIKMFYSSSTLLVPIYATKIQKNIRKYILLNTSKKILKKYLNDDCVHNIITIVLKYINSILQIYN